MAPSLSGSMWPSFLAPPCVRQHSREAFCAPTGSLLSYSVTSLLFMSQTPAQDICFIRFPFWVSATFRGANRPPPAADLCVSQLEGPLHITANSNRGNIQQRNETNRCPRSEPEGTHFHICFVIDTDVCRTGLKSAAVAEPKKKSQNTEEKAGKITLHSQN